jgi:DNA-binding response OmpR family regulator
MAALLDIGLGDGPSFSVAEFLAGRGVPFAFLTGYDATDIPLQLRDHPILNKPMSFDRLLNVVRALCSPAREQTHYATTTHLSALPDAPDQDRTNTT